MKLYLLTVVGISVSIPAGVFSTREAAEAHAAAMWPRSDGYHDMQVTEIALDQEIDVACHLQLGRRHDEPRTPPRIYFESLLPTEEP